jgi:NADH-quinone oxidoreductase subunit G/NADP-reducing hydrogenase subunit HndD
MVFNIEVNKRPIEARRGETILSALRRNGIHVPTLCNMKDYTPTGACRMCVVEIEGRDKLIPSCSYQVEDWMKISTHSPRVLKARKTIVELLLSNHPDDCLYCERNGKCELQTLAKDLNIRERRIPGRKSRYKIDKSSSGIVRDAAKCILCGRCVRVCEESQGVACLDFTKRGSKLIVATAMAKPLNFSNCINCGQCVMSCPTGSLTEKIQFEEISHALYDPEKMVIAQYSPTIAVSLSEEFGLKGNKDVNGIINAALRKIGFKKVYESSFAADVNILEMADEFIQRFEKGEKLPMITGDCPAWVKFAEQAAPDFLSNITTVKSPQQITGALIKTWIAEKENISPGRIFSVSIMPCTAKKYEGQRVEMTRKGISDIDTVLTTRELVGLIRLHGIDVHQLEPEPSDEPMGGVSSSGKIFGVSGGVMESLVRTVYYKSTGEELGEGKVPKLRSFKHVREAQLMLGKRALNVVAVSGINNVIHLLEEVRLKRKHCDIIEIMACPGGCVAGGGQPISQDENAVRNRIKALYETEGREKVKTAHKNPLVIALYEDFLTEPLSKKSKDLIHIAYSPREVTT